LTEKEAQTYLKEVATSIKFLNKKAQKEVFKRGLDVLSEVMTLKKYASGTPIHETRDIARQEFLAGVQRYLIGFFDDSIYHSTLSVEMGLLIRLEEELSIAEKSVIHDSINSKTKPLSFTFGTIFDEAKKRNSNIIKNKQTLKKIAKIIDTRNTHIHASNFTSASILSMKEIGPPEIEKGLKDLELIEKTPLVKIWIKKSLPQLRSRLTETRSVIENLPSFEWCTKDKQRTQAQNDVNDFFNDQFNLIDEIRHIDSTKEKVQTGLHSRKLIRDMSEENYSKRKALETIRDSFEVLKGIGIFEE
jgi:hypothetical protein